MVNLSPKLAIDAGNRETGAHPADFLTRLLLNVRVARIGDYFEGNPGDLLHLFHTEAAGGDCRGAEPDAAGFQSRERVEGDAVPVSHDADLAQKFFSVSAGNAYFGKADEQ